MGKSTLDGGSNTFQHCSLMNEEGSRWRRNGSLLRCLWQEKVPQYQDTLRNLGYRLWVNIVLTENRMLKLPWSPLTADLCSLFLVHHHFCDQNSKICPLTSGQVTIFGQYIIILLWKILIFSIRINTAMSWLSPDFQRRPLHILFDYRSQNISIGKEKTKESTGRARPSRKSPINSHHNWPRLSAWWSGDPTGSGDSIRREDSFLLYFNKEPSGSAQLKVLVAGFRCLTAAEKWHAWASPQVTVGSRQKLILVLLELRTRAGLCGRTVPFKIHLFIDDFSGISPLAMFDQRGSPFCPRIWLLKPS